MTVAPRCPNGAGKVLLGVHVKIVKGAGCEVGWTGGSLL